MAPRISSAGTRIETYAAPAMARRARPVNSASPSPQLASDTFLYASTRARRMRQSRATALKRARRRAPSVGFVSRRWPPVPGSPIWAGLRRARLSFRFNEPRRPATAA